MITENEKISKWLINNKIDYINDFNVSIRSWLKAGGTIKTYITPKDYQSFYSFQAIEGIGTITIIEKEEEEIEKQISQFFENKSKEPQEHSHMNTFIPSFDYRDPSKMLKEYDNGGYCATWTLVWVLAVIQNPDKTLRNI